MVSPASGNGRRLGLRSEPSIRALSRARTRSPAIADKIVVNSAKTRALSSTRQGSASLYAPVHGRDRRRLAQPPARRARARRPPPPRAAPRAPTPPPAPPPPPGRAAGAGGGSRRDPKAELGHVWWPEDCVVSLVIP